MGIASQDIRIMALGRRINERISGGEFEGCRYLGGTAGERRVEGHHHAFRGVSDEAVDGLFVPFACRRYDTLIAPATNISLARRLCGRRRAAPTLSVLTPPFAWNVRSSGRDEARPAVLIVRYALLQTDELLAQFTRQLAGLSVSD